MASGIARGRVRTTTTTESRKMAAILQLKGWQKHTALIYSLLLWYWTSMLWSIDTCQIKVSADRYYVTISWAQVQSSSRSRAFKSWRQPKRWFSIGSWAHVWITCCKRGRVARKPVNANPGLKLTEVYAILLYTCFSLLLFSVFWDYSNSKQKAKQYTENLAAKLQNSNQSSRLNWVILIGLWTARPRSPAFRLE